MTRVLVVAPMSINQERRGPTIRSWELARVLSHVHQVTLLAPNEDHPRHPDFEVRACAQSNAAAPSFDALLARHEVIVMQGPAIQAYPRLAEIVGQGQHYLVVDLYDPISLEWLASESGSERGSWLHLEQTALQNEQLRLGDFFLCANERQQDYWLGALAALGRLNHDTWDGSDFRHLVDIVPFGLPAEPPGSGPGPVLKGIVPGIGPADQVVIWGGGVWDWLDPLTPIGAMEKVAVHKPGARLVFFQLANGWTAMSERARQLAGEMGLLDRQVIFAPWLSPEQWPACLLEADVGLCFHPHGIETHFASRTRLLDYIWAGLPIATSGGDVLGQLVADHGLGHVVEPGNAEALAAALLALLDEPNARSARLEAFSAVATGLTWEEVARPLVDYCSAPWHAGDMGPSFTRRWLAAQRDRILSEAAHAGRRRVEAETYARTLESRLSTAQEQLGRLQHQLDDTSQELRHSEERFRAAMSGRIMRLMTGVQRAWRRLGRKKA